jgi:hypothetical protein
VQVSGDGLEAGGQEQGMTIYARSSVPANIPFTVNVSGTAPPPSAGNNGDNGQEAQQGAPTGSISVSPGRLDVLKWPLIGGFVGIFALGAIFLARRPVVAVAAVGSADRSGAAAPTVKDAAPAATRAVVSNSPSLTEVDAAVGVSLDALKDQLFRLELRRQAGTISQEEYAQERARAEKVLRDLVRG